MSNTSGEAEVFPSVFIATTIFCFICSPISSLANFTIIYGLHKYHVGKRRTPSSFLYLNLAVSDFLTGQVLGLLFSADALLDVFGLNSVILEDFIFSVGGLLVFASNFTITAILFERLIAVGKPLRYRNFFTTKTAKLIITGIWVASLLVSFLPLCIPKWEFLLIFSHIHISLPLFCLVSMSLAIFTTINKQRKELMESITSSNPKLGLQLAKEFHHRRIERDRRLTITIILVVVFFCVILLPIFIGVHLVIHLRSCEGCFFSEYYQRAIYSLCYFSIRFIMFNTVVNPFLLYWRIPRIREAVQVLCFRYSLRCHNFSKVAFNKKSNANGVRILRLTTYRVSSMSKADEPHTIL